jgi:O-succinylbenzoic acid--CoA ligase
MNYTHKSIWINGRFVTLNTIVDGHATPLSSFEHDTFSFIREWASGAKTFSLNTSGSTGAPKTISIERDQMIASAKATEAALQLKKNYSALTCIDTKYIGGKMMLVRSFVTDMAIFVVDPCPCPLQKIPVDHCVNFTAFVPYQVQSMLESKHPHLLDYPDVIIVGGAAIDDHVIEQLQRYHSRCYATYGMTETISHVALRPLNGINRTDYFKTLPGVTIQQDERSCLTIAAHYLPHKIITNDLVEIIGAEQFKWTGRWDNVINTGGIKVIPEKIESTLVKKFSEAGITNRFFIHGIPNQKLGSEVVIVIEASDNSNTGVEKILPIVSLLEKFERPRKVLTAPAFATTENGKINRFKTLETINSSFPILQ